MNDSGAIEDNRTGCNSWAKVHPSMVQSDKNQK